MFGWGADSHLTNTAHIAQLARQCRRNPVARRLAIAWLSPPVAADEVNDQGKQTNKPHQIGEAARRHVKKHMFEPLGVAGDGLASAGDSFAIVPIRIGACGVKLER